jgi:drug/metabolite transporter (DMT)-like permease
MATRNPTLASSENLKFGLTALIIANICLSFGPWFVRQADVGPVASAFWRMALATPLLMLIARNTGQSARLTRTQAGILLASGIFFAADLASWHLGIFHTKLANANLLGNAASFLLPIYGFIVAKAWPTRMQGMAIILAVLGAVLLMGRSYELSPQNFVGDLLCLAAGIFYTAYLVMMANMRGALAPWPTLAWSTLASCLPLLVFAVVTGETVWPTNWTPLIILAVLSQVVGQGLLIYVLGRMPPLVLGLALLTQPIISATIGWWAYGEVLTLLDWVGAALIGLALILVRQPEPLQI